MTKHPIRKALTGMLVMALLLVGTAVPALAVASGSVTIKSGADLLSGADDQKIVFTVNNTARGSNPNVPLIGTAGTSIDLVQFVPPAGFFDYPEGEDSFPVGDFTGPDGWTPYVQSDVIRFVADEGKEIPAGEARDFTLEFDVKPQAKDASDMVFVSVSDDNGMTLTTAGVPNVNIRTLLVDANLIDVVKPALADNQSGLLVTEQQDNAKVSVTVVNRGSAAQTVTPAVSKNSGSSSITVGTAPSGEVLPGQSKKFEVPVTFGGVGDLKLQAAASASGSNAITVVSSKTIAVQERIRLNLTPETTITPNAVNPLATAAPTFTVRLNKTGGPAADDAGLTTKLSIGSVSGTATFTPAAGAVNNSPVAFNAVNVTSLADDLFGATVQYSGEDANGATVVAAVLNVGNVLIDRLNQVVTIKLTPPATAVAGTEAAASFSDSVSVTGNVTRGTGACTDCRVAATAVKMNGRSFPATANVSISATGAVSGSITMPGGTPENLGSYAEGDNLLTLDLTVGRRVNGIDSPKTGFGSADAPVDIIRPDLKDPVAQADGRKTGTVTGRDAEGDYVDVIFTERVNFGQFSSAADWIVDGKTVTEVRYVGEGNERATTDRIRLRLLEPLANNAEPTTTYNPQNPLGRSAYDRVQLAFSLPDAVDVADGIAPAALDLVSLTTYREGLGDNSANAVAQGPLNEGGELVFVTRDNTPTLTVADVLAGDTVTAFVDTNRNGEQDGGEASLGSNTNNGIDTADLDIPLSIGSVDADIPVGVFAIDSNRNRGVSFTNFTIRYDNTRIQIADFSRTGQNVTVTLTEGVTTLEGYEGRDGAIDWFVQAGGRWRPVDAVSNSDGNAATRSLNVNAMVVPAGTEITGVRYEFVSFGPEADNSKRYLDRALNEIADGAFTR